MVRKLIVGWDGGARARDALRFGAVIAAATRARLVVAHVYPHDARFHLDEPDTRLTRRANALTLLAEAEAMLPYGQRAELRAVASRSPVQGLHELAESEGADLTVLGATTKGSLELHAIGSVPERLLHGAPCAVAVAPVGFADEVDPALRVIGVAYDGSAEAIEALKEAADLALAARAAIKLIGVVDRQAVPVVGMSAMYALEETPASYRDAVRRQLAAAVDALPPELRAEVVLADGEPAEELIERAPVLSLLVMGSRGYGPVRRALLGSISAPIVRAAPCPVVVVPRANHGTAAVAGAAAAALI